MNNFGFVLLCLLVLPPAEDVRVVYGLSAECGVRNAECRVTSGDGISVVWRVCTVCITHYSYNSLLSIGLIMRHRF